LRRAAISISSNIAEGAARNSKKEFVQYLYIALGLLSELETQLYLSQRLGYISKNDKLFENIDQVRRMLLGLIKFTKGKKNE
jgi:four helix bundle protein